MEICIVIRCQVAAGVSSWVASCCQCRLGPVYIKVIIITAELDRKGAGYCCRYPLSTKLTILHHMASFGTGGAPRQTHSTTFSVAHAKLWSVQPPANCTFPQIKAHMCSKTELLVLHDDHGLV